MAEIVKNRMRESDPAQMNIYERTLNWLVEWRERAFKRAVVIRGDAVAWEQSRQGRLKFFINRETDDKCLGALRDWNVFLHDIKTHSGSHRHQGGLVIYVVEGEGCTEVDGETLEWEAGDLLLLPIKPKGCEHKHYNKHPGKSAVWIAFIYSPYQDELGKWIEQKEVSPDFK